VHRWLLLAALCAACPKKKVPSDAAPAPALLDAGTGGTHDACLRFSLLAPLEEVARTCVNLGVRVEPQGEECTYWLAPNPNAWVRIAFAGEGPKAYEARRKALGPLARPAPTLGERGLVRWDRERQHTSILLMVGPRVVTLEASAAYCPAGPLLRIARLLYERAARR
jgi:hypothetical protein